MPNQRCNYLRNDGSSVQASYRGLECGDCDLGILGRNEYSALSLSILEQSWQKLELTIASCITCSHGSSWDLSRESPSGGSDW